MDTDAWPSGGSVNSSSAGFGSQSKLRANSGSAGSPARNSEQPNGVAGVGTATFFIRS